MSKSREQYLQTVLKQLESADAPYRADAVRKLLNLDGNQVMDALERALDGNSPLVRLTAAQVLLCKWHNAQRATQTVIDSLGQGTPAIRYTAVYTLWYFELTGTADVLVKSLTDPDESVRLSALFPLADWGDLRAEPMLIDLLNGTVQGLQRRAHYLLSRLRRERPFPLQRPPLRGFKRRKSRCSR